MPSSGYYAAPLEVEEVEAINNAVIRAGQSKMEAEFWGTFLNAIRMGRTVFESIRAGLEEWDI